MTHRVLLLGAGLVSRPIARFFLDQEDVRLTVASLHASDAERLVDRHPRGHAAAVDVTDSRAVQPWIATADLVVSLVPFGFHAAVAKLALAHGAHVVTTSYVSPEMRALDAEARRAGLVLLNEIGLDPGLDHMSAVRLLRRLRDSGAEIRSFVSCCGSLPAPEVAARTPWGYKFSWSPRGAFLAARNAARYLVRGTVCDVPGPELFDHRWTWDVDGFAPFEMYPNRDALAYVPSYELEGAETVLRGTLRWPGWCETLAALGRLGLLETEAREYSAGTTWAELSAGPGAGPARERVALALGLPPNHAVLERLAWVGLLDDEPLPPGPAAPLDLLVARSEPRLAYRAGERDMIVLQHEITTAHAVRGPERVVSSLVAYGEPDGDSATARTVSLPAAVASRLILDRRLRTSGVQVPTAPEIVGPVLDALEPMGLGFEERVLPATRAALPARS